MRNRTGLQYYAAFVSVSLSVTGWSQDNFPDIQDGSWHPASNSIDTFRYRGFALGPRPISGYPDYSQDTIDIVWQIQPYLRAQRAALLKLSPSAAARMQRDDLERELTFFSSDWRDDLQKLIKESEVGIIKLGYTKVQLAKEIEKSAPIAADCAARLKFLMSTVSWPRQSYVDVPEHHEPHEVFHTFVGLGMIAGRTPPRFNYAPMTRGEFAKLAIDCSKNLAAFLPALRARIKLQKSPAHKWSPYDVSLGTVGSSMMRLDALFKVLFDEFGAEIRELGSNPVALLKLVERSRPEAESIAIIASAGIPRDSTYFEYLDLPRRHWAARAVSGLRNEGILKGYPDGTFGGGR